jgi:hypothetical protein
MMISIKTFTIQLCWILLLVSPFVRSQIMNGDASTARNNVPTSGSDGFMDLEEVIAERFGNVKSISTLRKPVLTTDVAAQTQ